MSGFFKVKINPVLKEAFLVCFSLLPKAVNPYNLNKLKLMEEENLIIFKVQILNISNPNNLITEEEEEEEKEEVEEVEELQEEEWVGENINKIPINRINKRHGTKVIKFNSKINSNRIPNILSNNKVFLNNSNNLVILKNNNKMLRREHKHTKYWD